MLTFFRRIRKGLLGTSQTRKYLLYAIGEIALVVIGILIALSINNWNNRVQQHKQEIAWIESLHGDLLTDEKLLNEQMEYLNESSQVIGNLISVIDSPDHIIEDTLGYLRQLKRTTMTFFFTPTATTYMEITGSGKLSISAAVSF